MLTTVTRTRAKVCEKTQYKDVDVNREPLVLNFLGALSVVCVLFSSFSSPMVLAVTMSEKEYARWTQHWNMLSRQIANSLIDKGRLDNRTVYIDRKPTALRNAHYLTQQLQRTLVNTGIRMASLNKADFVVELDMKMRKRSDGIASAHSLGSDVDQFWVVQEVDLSDAYRSAYFELTPLQNLNALAGTDTEVIVTVRIMQMGWISLKQTYAYYFVSTDLQFDEVGEMAAVKNQQVATYPNEPKDFLEMYRKRDAKIEQLLNMYGY